MFNKMSKRRIFNGFHNTKNVWNLSHIDSIPITNNIPENDETIRYNKSTNSWELINTNEFYGPQGPQGPQGEDSIEGPQGPQGLVGFTGNFGFNGDTGPNGTIGIEGTPGTDGNTGFNGPQGVIGFTGATGTNGNIGITNVVEGPIGKMGPQGPQGYPGQGLSFSSITTVSCQWSDGVIFYGQPFTLNCERINNIIRISVPGVSFILMSQLINIQAFYLTTPSNVLEAVLPSTYVPSNDTWMNIGNTNILESSSNVYIENFLTVVGVVTTTGLSPGSIVISNPNAYSSTANQPIITIYGFCAICYTTS